MQNGGVSARQENYSCDGRP